MLDRGLQKQGEFELNLGVAIGTLKSYDSAAAQLE
jgi:hypothetical protein